jgi:hypothetical protein
MLAGDVQLNDQVGPSRSALGVIEQHAEHLRGHCERKVGDDSIPTRGKAEVAQIRVHDPHPAGVAPGELSDALAQSLGPYGIGLDRDDIRTGARQWKGQGAAAGAEFDQRFARGEIEIADDRVDQPTVNEKVLAEGASPSVARGAPTSCGHGGPSS